MRLFIAINYLILKVRLRIVLLIFLFSGARLAVSQILNDSVKEVYGHHTTFFVTEEDIFEPKQKPIGDDGKRDTTNEHSVDTTIHNMQNYGYVYKDGTINQDLGALTTPLSPIFYKAPTQIGKTFGFNGYSPYAFDPNKVKYYNTRSPYTMLEYVQGTLGQQILKAEFSRNIKPNWNIGIDFRTMSALKTIGFHQQVFFTSSNRDLQGNNDAFTFYTRYFTKDNRYQILANLTYFDTRNYETGGIQPAPTGSDSQDSLFNYKLENIRLKIARSLEKRVNYHVYHQYSLSGNSLQLYHIVDYYNQSDRFTDGLDGATDVIVPNGLMTLTPRFDTAATDSRTSYRLLENKIGVKGARGKWTYRAYYRLKDFSYTLNYSPINAPSKSTFTENFVGGYSAYKTGYFSQLSATGEYFFAGYNSDGLGKNHGDYSLKLDYTTKNLSVGYNSIYYSPSLMQRDYTSNFDVLYWKNNFTQTRSNMLYGKLDIKLGKVLAIHPSVSNTWVYNYIYYNTQGVPQQDGGLIKIFSPELTFELTVGRFHLDNYYRYTLASGNGASYIHMPKHFDWLKFYYQNSLFKNALTMQLGIEVFYRSNYLANYYMPVTQQYYLDNSFIHSSSYLVSNLFFNLKIKSVIGFVKLSNLNQLAQPNSGYFMTPYYPGMPFAFEFGLKWMFFD